MINWPGSREAHLTNWSPLAVTAIVMWGLRQSGQLVYLFFDWSFLSDYTVELVAVITLCAVSEQLLI